MTGTSVNATIRRADTNDLPLLRRAMEAMPYDVQAASASEMAMALEEGTVQVYMLEREDAVMVVGVQRDEGGYAQFGALYREGAPEGLLRDCRALLSYILPILAQDGVRHVGLQLSVNNRLYERLYRLYSRLGFRSAAIVMAAEIGVR